MISKSPSRIHSRDSRMLEDIAPGIQLLGRFGKSQSGIWFLRHLSECAIVEMPDTCTTDPIQEPWDALQKYIEENDFYLKFLTASHDQADQFYSLPDFHATFPDVPVLVHRDFFLDPNDVQVESTFTPEDLEDGGLTVQDPSVELEGGIPVYCFEGDVFETDLAGEPLTLIHAPKHSLSDTLVVFRGCLITADWWLGAGDPNYYHVPVDRIRHSIDVMLKWSRDTNYKIHSVFSAHANEFRRDVDFSDLMEQTRP